MKYSSVIFDWDGTLGMTLHLWLDGYRNELEKLGFHYSDKVIVDDFFYEHVKAKVKYPDIDFKTFVPPVYKYVNSHISSLKQADILKFFSVIVSGDDVKKHKPDPEPFEQIIEIAKISPKDSIVLGDSHTDILAAKAAGLDSCLFLPFENKIFYDFTKLMESNPTYSVENLKDFADLILKT